ncbi:DUF4268 domain-containing protein [Halodesulfovibrio marinisediminis]|nr:DUF4268 domain-containing protein [Halodesulfovibrio marinisediminis]
MTEDNKFFFDYQVGMKDEIERTFGESLEWLRLDNKKSSRIKFFYKI